MRSNDDPVARLLADLARQERMYSIVQAIVAVSLAFAVGFFGAAWWAL